MSRVLIVDDELDVAEVVRLVLEERGLEVATACDGADAKAFLERETPSLIITDVMMPHVGGIELVKWARNHERLRLVPIIVMSAIRPQGGNVGWEAFLQKPFTLARLTSSVNAMLNR